LSGSRPPLSEIQAKGTLGACSLQPAVCSLQSADCSLQPAACSLQIAACSLQTAGCRAPSVTAQLLRIGPILQCQGCLSTGPGCRPHKGPQKGKRRERLEHPFQHWLINSQLSALSLKAPPCMGRSLVGAPAGSRAYRKLLFRPKIAVKLTILDENGKFRRLAYQEQTESRLVACSWHHSAHPHLPLSGAPWLWLALEQPGRQD